MPRYLKNIRSQLVGWTSESNGIDVAHNRQGQLVGWYNRKTNQTHDKRGRLVTTAGDASSKLIFEDGDGDE